MADEVSEVIENALNLIESNKEQSGNMKKVLKQTIFERVTTFTKLFVKLRNRQNSKTTDISKLEMEVTKLKSELEEFVGKHAMEHWRHLLSYVNKQLT
jgi:hypothetical protein